MTWRNSAPIILFLFVNSLFAYKYGGRLTQPYIALTGYCVWTSLVFWVLYKFDFSWFTRKLAVGMGLSLSCGLLVVYHFIPQEMLNVDRWSVITSFWDTVVAGRYPYSARSHEGSIPGPFPGYFVLAFPFWVIGELGCMTLVGLWAYFIVAQKKIVAPSANYKLFLLMLSAPALYWEAIVRSTLIFNVSLIIIYLFLLDGCSLFFRKNRIWLGIAGGVILSTRGIAAIPLITVFTFLGLRRNYLREVTEISLITGCVFLMTLVPLLFWGDEFLISNPLSVQSGFLPTWVTVLLMLLAFLSGLIATSLKEVLFYDGLVIALSVFISFGIILHQFGWNESIFMHHFDISYFLLPLSFLTPLAWENWTGARQGSTGSDLRPSH